jgi:AcrR family transcriptional regulator
MSIDAPSRRSRAQMAQETTERLLGVARHAFAEQGFAAVSLDALAAEAGVTRGALHHHFGNKAGLFEAVLRRIDTEIGAELDALWDSEADPWTAFRRCFHAYLDAALRPDRRRILFQDAPAVLGMRAYDILLDSGLHATIEELDRIIASGRIAPVDPTALAHLLNGAIMNLAFWAAEGSGPQDRLARAHATLGAIFRGLEG